MHINIPFHLRNMSCLRAAYEYRLNILQLYINSLPTQSYSRPHQEGENEEGDQPSQTGKENGGALTCERGKEGPCPLIIIAYLPEEKIDCLAFQQQHMIRFSGRAEVGM